MAPEILYILLPIGIVAFAIHTAIYVAGIERQAKESK